MKRKILDHIKNIRGVRTNRKYVVFAVDDYGNIRLDSKSAKDKMKESGLNANSLFDEFDALENTEDLDALYDVLRSVKDKNNRSAVFTPLSMSGNINFEEMARTNYEYFVYENLTKSYEKLEALQPAAYKKTYLLWREGISKGLMEPEFHGREHLNLKVLTHKLKSKDKEVITALRNRSYGMISDSGFPNISYTAAYEFENLEENRYFEDILSQGIRDFEQVYGYTPTVFNSPGGREHPLIHEYLKKSEIRYIETPFLKQEHQGNGNYKKIMNYTGKKNSLNMIYSVRNAVFEPNYESGFDWVNFTMAQIDAAFFWKKPALISSHRVNFCGHIDPKNREKGLNSLKELLKKIVQKYPDVEFIGLGQLLRELFE